MCVALVQQQHQTYLLVIHLLNLLGNRCSIALKITPSAQPISNTETSLEISPLSLSPLYVSINSDSRVWWLRTEFLGSLCLLLTGGTLRERNTETSLV